jgi:uncharacterized repeat protein (TIGR03803 family)
MLNTRIADILKTNWKSGQPGLACVLFIALAAASLYAQTFKDLYDFDCSGDGCFPYDYGQATQGLDGQLYGSAVNGPGSPGLGTIFKVEPIASPVYTTLWKFDGANTGEFPQGGLTLASDGYFYGTTSAGGTYNAGTLFRISSSGALTVLHHFSSTEGAPLVAPVQGKDGNLYGVTGSGTTYRVTLLGGTFVQLSHKAPGAIFGTLLLATDGYLYATTQTGGENNMGTIFRMTTPGGAIKIIHSFSGSDGSAPQGPLTQGSDGNLYGTTTAGGANNTGESFKLTLASTITVLHSFDSFVGGPNCNVEGGNPVAGLLAATDGYFYGVTSVGGANCIGTIFRIAADGTFEKIFDFDESGSTSIYGELSYTTLVQHTYGCFYGLTSMGGIPNGQTNPMGNAFTMCPEHPAWTLKWAGPIFVKAGAPVQILGNNLLQATLVTIGGVTANFQFGSSSSYLTAQVPTTAVDGFVIVTLMSGRQSESQVAMHILPVITNLDPSSGPVGTQVNISGGGFAGATNVIFGGVKATNFTVVTPALIQATVPSGAKTGKVTVTTPNGTVKSKQTFTVI